MVSTYHIFFVIKTFFHIHRNILEDKPEMFDSYICTYMSSVPGLGQTRLLTWALNEVDPIGLHRESGIWNRSETERLQI